MDFVFGHSAKPFPDSEGRTAGRHARALELFRREAAQNVECLGVRALEELQDIVIRWGEFRAATGVAAGSKLEILGEHVSFDGGDVSDEVAEREASWMDGPVESIGRDAVDDAPCALTDSAVVLDERLDACDFHAAIVRRHEDEINRIDILSLSDRELY